jgi:propanol-preferring alcohol dehydrogenase
VRALVLDRPHQPLVERDLPRPTPAPGQVLIQVLACGVCRTDLHIVDGELDQPGLPLILGHQVVGTVAAIGESTSTGLSIGTAVGVPWLAWTDQTCRYCRRGQENLCPRARFTGYTVDGGYAEYLVADADYCFELPPGHQDLAAAPLLCAGLIGFRTWRLAGRDVERLGIYGFGAAGHLVAQVAIHHGQEVYAFTRPGDREAQALALGLGARWAGGSDVRPPQPLDAALIFAPVGGLVVSALEATAPGGTVVCGGIHMSDIPSFPYRLLWEERVIRSVANLTRQDGLDFFALLSSARIKTTIHRFPASEANAALEQLRKGDVTGAAVLDWTSTS